MSQKILITGGNGEFGRLAVNKLLAAGHSVVATMRDPKGRNKEPADTLIAAGANVVDIDVTDEANIENGVVDAIETLGGLDVLINNAGTGAHGLLEGFSGDQMLRLSDVNVVGPHRMMRAVLPYMRDQSAGLILNVSSLLGRISLPFYGPYSATKFALETMTETYRAELSQFGVDVAIIEPGGFSTTFVGNLVRPNDTARLSGYGAFAYVPAMSLQSFHDKLDANPLQDPVKVAEAMVMVIATPAGQRDFRTIVDFMGMADTVGVHNAGTLEMTNGMHTAFGIAHLRTLKTQ